MQYTLFNFSAFRTTLFLQLVVQDQWKQRNIDVVFPITQKVKKNKKKQHTTTNMQWVAQDQKTLRLVGYLSTEAGRKLSQIKQN